MIFDFRHMGDDGKWKSSGHCKGTDRDAAFDALQRKNGELPAGRYMSRPRDGQADWDLFNWPKSAEQPVQTPRRRGRHF